MRDLTLSELRSLNEAYSSMISEGRRPKAKAADDMEIDGYEEGKVDVPKAAKAYDRLELRRLLSSPMGGRIRTKEQMEIARRRRFGPGCSRAEAKAMILDELREELRDGVSEMRNGEWGTNQTVVACDMVGRILGEVGKVPRWRLDADSEMLVTYLRMIEDVGRRNAVMRSMYAKFGTDTVNSVLRCEWEKLGGASDGEKTDESVSTLSSRDRRVVDEAKKGIRQILANLKYDDDRLDRAMRRLLEYSGMLNAATDSNDVVDELCREFGEETVSCMMTGKWDRVRTLAGYDEYDRFVDKSNMRRILPTDFIDPTSIHNVDVALGGYVGSVTPPECIAVDVRNGGIAEGYPMTVLLKTPVDYVKYSPYSFRRTNNGGWTQSRKMSIEFDDSAVKRYASELDGVLADIGLKTMVTVDPKSQKMSEVDDMYELHSNGSVKFRVSDKAKWNGFVSKLKHGYGS